MSARSEGALLPRYRTAGADLSAFDAVFGMLWLFIAFVSVWDGYLTVACRHQLRLLELNPIGRALIELNGGGVLYLLVAKLLGTAIATAWMVLLYDRNPRRGLIIAAAVASFQLWLLMFLTFA